MRSDEERSSCQPISTKNLYNSKVVKTIDSTANEQITKVKEEAEKRYQQKMAEIKQNMMEGKNRIEEQKRLLEEKIELQKQKRAAHIEFKNRNVERQRKKDEYRKNKLQKMQEEQDRKIREFMEGKESLFSQSQYLKFANDLRKYHLKRELEVGKTITIDKIMDINDNFKPKDFKPDPGVKREDVRKMVAHIMSRPIQSSAGRFSRSIKSTGQYEDLLVPHQRKSTENNIQ